MAYPAKYSTLNELQLTQEARRILVRIIRVAFPHPKIPDGPYERMADKIITESNESTWFRVALTQGLLTLNQQGGENFLDLSDDRALAVLQRIADLDFFGFIRRTTVLNFYDDPEVWDVFGYEGESFSKGGYLHRGFDDLDWLPSPRVEEADEPLTEIGPLGYDIAQQAPQRVRDAADSTGEEPVEDLFKGQDKVEEGRTI
ncbi:gluconate 2-dehydrogenase subunit 3 family protein [Arthrobacter sp. TMT4-20]